MKTLLALIASPRKHGNCELFAKEVRRQLTDEWHLQLLRLPELDIRPCKACYRCLFGEMTCPQKDDLSMTLQHMVTADALLVAAPTYFLGANSSLKRLLDRGLSFYKHLDELWRKPAVGVAIAGIEGMEGYTKLMVDSFLKLCFSDHRGSEVLYGALPGEIFLDGNGKEIAKNLAQGLLEESPRGENQASTTSTPRCSLCGGDTFRFLGDNRIRCMLCSSEGTYDLDGQQLQLHASPGEHPLFLKYEDAKRHLEWLRQMKDEFLRRRNELKAITREYTDTAKSI